MGTLRGKRDELVAVLELLLEEGSDPNCRQGSTGPRSEVGVGATDAGNECGETIAMLDGQSSSEKNSLFLPI